MELFIKKNTIEVDKPFIKIGDCTQYEQKNTHHPVAAFNPRRKLCILEIIRLKDPHSLLTAFQTWYFIQGGAPQL